MKLPTTLVFTALLAGLAFSANPARAGEFAPDPILLWPNGAPGATGTTNEDKPAIYPYLAPAAKNTGAAVIVCPGGGFNHRAVDYEGVLISQWYIAHGINAFLLRYRVQPVYTQADGILDGQRAIQYVRTHAAEFKINPDHIGIIGFSAGDDLVSATSQAPLAAKPDSADPVERVSSRPNFSIYAYGGNGTHLDTSLGANAAPPSFMYGTEQDTGSLKGMISLYLSFLNLNVPVEVHFFENGEHGTAFAQDDPVLGEWPTLMYNWIRAGGFLTDQPRVASLRGTVNLDGKPLPHGYVVFTPVDAPAGTPPFTCYVMNDSTADGEYLLGPRQFAAPGKYKVEVHEDAQIWVSQNRDPVLTALNPRGRGGAQNPDRAALIEQARNRNMEPSIENLRVYSRGHPTDSKDLIVELKADDNTVPIEVFSK